MPFVVHIGNVVAGNIELVLCPVIDMATDSDT